MLHSADRPTTIPRGVCTAEGKGVSWAFRGAVAALRRCSGWLCFLSFRRAPRRPRRTSRSRPRSAPRSTCFRAPARSRATTATRRASTRWTAGRGPTTSAIPGACQRLRFSYGPIAVKPGQNDVLVGPVTIEKPMRDGYITRFEPNLVRADGTVPPVEQVHLHHGTWLSLADYGSGPFFAAGEEKTIAPFPTRLRDAGQGDRHLAAALHGPLGDPEADEAYITYDIDFIPKAKARGARDQARVPALARRAARRATRSSTPSATSAASDGSARGRRRSARSSTRAARRSSARARRATAWARTSSCPSSASRSGRSRTSPAAR